MHYIKGTTQTAQEMVDYYARMGGMSEVRARRDLGIGQKEIEKEVEKRARPLREAGLPVDYCRLWLDAEQDLLEATLKSWEYWTNFVWTHPMPVNF